MLDGIMSSCQWKLYKHDTKYYESPLSQQLNLGYIVPKDELTWFCSKLGNRKAIELDCIRNIALKKAIDSKLAQLG